jgi:hypothetical protein
MINELYSKNEDIEVSFTTFNSNILTFRSELKNLTFSLSLVRLQKASELLEKTIERKHFSSQPLDGGQLITADFRPSELEGERIEMHLTLFDEHLNSRYFYFDFQKKWTGGGKFFVRSLELD